MLRYTKETTWILRVFEKTAWVVIGLNLADNKALIRVLKACRLNDGFYIFLC